MKWHDSSAMVLVALLASGCSSSMKVAPDVMDMSKGMSEQQAREVVAQMLTPRAKDSNPAHWGICKLTHKVSVDYQKGADVQLDNVGVGFNALRRERKVTAAAFGAAAATTLVTGYAPVSVGEYAYTPFRDVRRFDNIASIRIKEPSKLNSICFPDDGQSEVLVQEKSGMGDWYVALIPTENKGRFIAAWLRIKPDLKLVE
jgi:hypothetical protein